MPFPELVPPLAKALSSRGFVEPTPVQAAVLAADAAERDLLVSARTGSGKTVAFGLAIAPQVLDEEGRAPGLGEPRALVVAPTRELAVQVHRELSWLFGPAGLEVVSCVGGMDLRREQRLLVRGSHVVVGTPGRLCDHLRRGALDLSKLSVIVLDEGDEMLDMGFREELEALLDASPTERRTLLFSATMPKEIVALAKNYQRDALRLSIGAEDEAHGDIEHLALEVLNEDREHAVVNVLRYFDAKGALVFCRTREEVRHLHANLLERGFSIVALSGEMGQHERTRALQSLRDGRARACVATDVAARGLDLPDLGLVIQTELPHDKQVYKHRSGRTGRAGRKGTNVLLVTPSRRFKAQQLLRSAGIEAEWGPPPMAEHVRARDRERLLVRVGELAAESAEEDLDLAKKLIEEHGAEALVAALVREQRRELPEPEEIAEVPPPRPRDQRDDRPRPPYRPGKGGQSWKKKPFHRGKAPHRGKKH